MPGTFHQIYIQVVFSVKGRGNLISNNWKAELHKYIAGIIKGKGHKSIIVNGMPDHIHAFVGLKPVKESLHGRMVMVHSPILIHK